MHALVIVLCAMPLLRAEGIFKFTVEEKSPIDTFIADLSNQLPIKTTAAYSLRSLMPTNFEFVAVDNRTGQLRTRAILDRDEMCARQQCSCQSCELLFQLLVDSEQTVVSKVIEVKVQDRNDHSPRFDNQSMIHIIYIKENVPLGHRIVLPTANDPDEGLNSVQSYRLDGMHSDEFDVDDSTIDTPYLIVRSSLDRQRRAAYAVTLIAADNGPTSVSRSGAVQLDIRIVNDSIPTFVQSVYRIDVREDAAIGASLLSVEAVSDENAPVFYELLTESPFTIDRSTGRVQLKEALDYEREQSYRLIVKAYETSVPAYAVVFVRVIDVNDNPVSIEMKAEGNATLEQGQSDHSVISVPEAVPVGSVLAHVILSDLDSVANGNPYLQLTTPQPPQPFIYKLIYQNRFQNIKLYSLILHTKLDRETKALYKNIQLIAHDSGTPTLHTRRTISLNVTDSNDCVPQITTNSTIYDVNENNPVGLIIDTLTAYDCDLGVNAEYEYHLLNSTDLLVVNAATGQLSLNRSIDFEQLHRQKNRTTVELEFLVEIRDHGQPSLASERKIVLRIHDVNDHSPLFQQNQSYNWTFSRSVLQPRAVLGRVIANDDDSGLQGAVHYSIRSFDSCLTLDITAFGYVYVLAQSSCTYLTYIFEITARDYDTPNPRSSKQLLSINIDTDPLETKPLPRLVPASALRTSLDVNSFGNVSLIIDMTSNQSVQPRLVVHTTDPAAPWIISPTGEVRLIAQTNTPSHLLSFTVVDDYADATYSGKLRVDLCNSSIRNSCQQQFAADARRENQLLLFWAASLALLVTCICVFIFSIMTCLCCRKPRKGKADSTAQRSFSQCMDDFQSERTFKTSSASTMRDDDHDSACTIKTRISPGVISVPPNSCHRPRRSSPDHPARMCAYDIKLAELIRHNQYPPCVFLNPKPAHSLSTDYGFGSSEVSPSVTSCSSAKLEWSIEMGADHTPPRTTNKSSFVSARECVV